MCEALCHTVSTFAAVVALQASGSGTLSRRSGRMLSRTAAAASRRVTSPTRQTACVTTSTATASARRISSCGSTREGTTYLSLKTHLRHPRPTPSSASRCCECLGGRPTRATVFGTSKQAGRQYCQACGWFLAVAARNASRTVPTLMHMYSA